MKDNRVCALRIGCTCYRKAQRDTCAHFHFPCPSSISKVSSKRDDLREAGEWSILNNRPFSDKPQPGDYTPAQIRKGVEPRQVKGMLKAGEKRAHMARAEALAAERRRDIAVRRKR